MCPIVVAEKIRAVRVAGVGKNIPFEIGVKLLPKGRGIRFRDRFTDGAMFIPPEVDSEG